MVTQRFASEKGEKGGNLHCPLFASVCIAFYEQETMTQKGKNDSKKQINGEKNAKLSLSSTWNIH